MNTAITTAKITPEVKLFSRFLNIRSKVHHGQALDFVAELMDAAEDDPSLLPILDVLARAVAAYEETHYPMENPSAEAMMAFLMDQHGHNQSEMTDIAPRTVINEIIHGKRKLNRRHIERLCRKYRVSADLFIGNPPTAGEPG